MRPVVYNNIKTIVQTDDHVLIMVEWMHWPRVVRLGAEHLPEAMTSFGGDSIGWWEDDTLVVETTNFKDFMSPHPPRPDLRIVERFSYAEDGNLLYHFTVHDPDFEAPYSGEYPWTKTDKRMYEYACHEANYSMANTLRGARVLERKWIKQHGEPATVAGGHGMKAVASLCALLLAATTFAEEAWKAPRGPGGVNPDLNGVWQALNEAHWDIEQHLARASVQLREGPMGPVPAHPHAAHGCGGRGAAEPRRGERRHPAVSPGSPRQT